MIWNLLNTLTFHSNPFFCHPSRNFEITYILALNLSYVISQKWTIAKLITQGRVRSRVIFALAAASEFKPQDFVLSASTRAVITCWAPAHSAYIYKGYTINMLSLNGTPLIHFGIPLRAVFYFHDKGKTFSSHVGESYLKSFSFTLEMPFFHLQIIKLSPVGSDTEWARQPFYPVLFVKCKKGPGGLV